MLHDLLMAWQKTFPQRFYERVPIHWDSSNIDEHTIQSSFEFTDPPQVVFVKNFIAYEKAKKFSDLPPLDLTPDEEIAVGLTRAKLDEEGLENVGVVTLSGIHYDDEKNVLYLQSHRVDFALIIALNNHYFPLTSTLYKKNYLKPKVIAPLITKDDYTIFTRRRYHSFSFYSSAANRLLECNPATPLERLIENSAIRRVYDTLPQTLSKKSLLLCPPTIKGISIAATVGESMIGVTFITPVKLNLYRRVLKNEFAIERIKNIDVPLEAEKRDIALKFLEKKEPGQSLYASQLVSTALMANPHASFIPPFLPHTKTRVVPISIFSSKIPSPLLLAEEKEPPQKTLPPSPTGPAL